jgi:hypothetical protein
VAVYRFFLKGERNLKTIITLLLIVAFSISTACANSIVNASNAIEDSMTMNQWAYAFGGYFVQDQLKKDTRLTFLEREGISILLAYGKQKWISS